MAHDDRQQRRSLSAPGPIMRYEQRRHIVESTEITETEYVFRLTGAECYNYVLAASSGAPAPGQNHHPVRECAETMAEPRHPGSARRG